MRKSQEQIEQEYLYSQEIKKARALNEARLTSAFADKVAKAMVGSEVTNPFITGTIALADEDIDIAAIHKAVNNRYKAESVYEEVLPKTVSEHPLNPTVKTWGGSHGSARVTRDGSEGKSLLDVLRMPAEDFLVMPGHRQKWWEVVDPTNEQGQNWRNLEIPEVKTNEDILNMTEPQIIKWFIQDPQRYKDFQYKNFKPTMVDPKTGKPLPGSAWGTGDLVAQKFPTFEKVRQAQLSFEESQQPTGLARDLYNLQNELKGVGWLAGLIPKTIGMMTPDHIGPSGTIGVAGLNIPTRIDLTKIGTGARAVSKTAMTGFTGLAQFTGSNLEYALTHPEEFGTDILGIPKITTTAVDDYFKTVIQGNIITQIIKRGLDPKVSLELGGGFFPEGPAVEEARRQHDAGLPQIAGKTWSVGRAVQEPFIQTGLIDRGGYAATLLSGLFDATFDIATDLSMYFDPIQGLMKAFNLTHVGSTKLLTGRIADLVNEGWAAERKVNNASTVIPETLDMVWDAEKNSWVYGAKNIPVEELPAFGGILPRGSTLPAEIEAVARQQADEIISNNQLATMDSPPPVTYTPPYDTIKGRKESFGLVEDAGGTMRPNPMAIDAMPYTRDGRAALTKLASFDNAGQLYNAFLGNIPIGAVQEIQDIVDAAKLAGQAVDLKAVHKVLVDGVLSGDPLYHTFNTPGVMNQVVNQTGATFAEKVSGKTRQFATMPGSTFFDFDDPMASIKDMNNLMIIMKVPKEEREVMLSVAIRATTKEGPGARFDLANQFMDAVVGQKLRRQGVPEEFIKTVTRWSEHTDAIRIWSMDAIGQGYPTPWLEDGSSEIFRTIDGLNTGFIMMDPKYLRQVVRETTNLWKVMAPIRGNKKLERLLKPTLIEALERINGQVLKRLALGAPLPIRMATRIIPDELLRVAASGKLSPESLQMLGTFGHVNYTTHGVEIRTAKEITKLVPIVEEFDTLSGLLAIAKKQNDLQKVPILIKRIEKLEKEFGTKQQIEKQIKVYNERIDTVLPGSNKKLADNIEGLMADERVDPRVIHYERSNITQNAHVEREPAKWVTGTARDIVKMSSSPEYPPIAEAMIIGQSAVNALPDRFLNGDLKPLLKQFIETNGRINANWDWSDINNVTYWVASRLADIATRTTLEHDALNAIATGKFNGKAISAKDAWSVMDPTKEFSAFVKDVLLINPNRSLFAPFAESHATETLVKNNRFMTEGFKIYRDLSAKYARNPYTQYHKWKTIIELMPTMDPTEARKMADAIDKSDAPQWLKERVLESVDEAAGKTTRKQVEILGSMAGSKAMTDLLYDSSKKSYFGYAHTLNFGFFDAWKEQWSVWTRMIAEQPTLLYKAGIAQQGLQNTPTPDFMGGMPNQTILYTDPDTGKQAVAVPFSRLVSRMIGLDAQDQIQTENLTLLGQAVPGVFGVGAMIWGTALPKTEAFSSVRKIMFPWGDPKMKTQVADYFVPAWGQLIGAAATSLIPGIDNLAKFIETEQNDSIRTTTANAIMTNIAANRGGVPVSPEEREKLLKEVEMKTDLLSIWKGVLKIFSPGASVTKYYQKVGPDYMTQGEVLSDFRELTGPDKDYAEGVSQFLSRYGTGAWVYLAGSSVSNPGMQPTKEFAEWATKNGSVVDKYPLVGSYLGPQGGEYSPDAYSSQRSSGKTKVRTFESKLERSLNNLAWNRFNVYKDSLIRQGVVQGLTPEQIIRNPYYTSKIKEQQETLKKLYPMWNPRATSGENDREWVNQQMQIEKMVKDKKVISLPGGKALKEYWDYRTRNLGKAISFNPALANESWKRSVAGTRLRELLYEEGERVSKKYPEFSSLWREVLSTEFVSPDTVAE